MKKFLSLLLSLTLTACAPVMSLFTPPTFTPTLTPTPNFTPTPTATLTPTLTPTPTPVPNGPCDNPLVPLATGNRWTYRVTTANGEATYRLAVLERQDGANIVALVEYTDQKNNLTVQEPVICQEGAIENYPLFVMNMLFRDFLSDYIDTYHESGAYAPDYQSLAQNDWKMTWQADYLTEDEAYIKNPLGGSDLYILQSTPMELSFHMDGTQETVSTPAGNFAHAMKISQSYTMNVTITAAGSGSGTSNTLTLQTTGWYEPYIGLVRAQIDSASLGAEGAGIGLPIESTLELVEFIPGG
jgi:hypothetical protein